jgi:hypothetical protein
VISFRWHWQAWLAVPAVVSLTALGLGAAPAQAESPCYFAPGGDYVGVSCSGATVPLSYMYEEYLVPDNPSQDGASFAVWGGLEDPAGDTVLQNVLNWNGSSWSAYPEYFWGGKNNKNFGAIAVTAGDVLISTLTGHPCDSGGHCTWTETITDSNTGKSSTGVVGSEVPFTTVLGGVLELRSGSGCVELPYNGHLVFRDIVVVNISAEPETPAFGNSTPDRQCSATVSSNPTATDIVWVR